MKQLNAVKIIIRGTLLLSCLVLVSCAKESSNPSSVNESNPPGAAVNKTLVATPDAGSENGSGGNMPAYYDAKLFTINLKELPPNGETATIANNPGINTIYMSDPGLPNNQPFIAVIDAIQTDGFNPLWREVQIAFNTGFTPHQFFSDDEVNNAASGSNPEITLTTTDEIYRCAVVGTKH